jgi:hypothetical protein
MTKELTTKIALGNKMNNVKVKNPKHDGYIVYLHPRQGMDLELTLPTNLLEDDDWKVEIYSEYMDYSAFWFFHGSKIYEFKQKYDLTSWSKISNVQIAEIFIKWKGAARQKFPNRKIFVVLQGESAEQQEVLTIINPISTAVRMAPHQLLEVVTYDNDDNELSFTDEINMCIEINKPYLEIEKIAVKKVTHINDDGIYRDVNNDPHFINRHTHSLPINPRIDADSRIRPIRRSLPEFLYKATHFFYRIAKHCVSDVHNLANGSYKASEIVIYDDEHKVNSSYSVDVSIGVKGSLKSRMKTFGLTKRQLDLVSANTVKNESIIGNKILSKERFYQKGTLLINPSVHDNVEFINDEDNCLTVEIAPPHLFNPKCSVHSIWTVDVDPVWQYRHRNEPQNRLSLIKLDDRTINGTITQRFMFTPTKKSQDTQYKCTFLGIVKFTVAGFAHMTRCLSFYIFNANKTTSKTESAPYVLPLPTKVIVKIQEFYGDDLIVKESRSEKFCDIKIDDTTTISKGSKKKKDDIKISER